MMACVVGGRYRVLHPEATAVLRWALIFLVIALVAAALGLSGVAWLAQEIAWILFVVFLVLFLVSVFFGRRGPPPV